VAVAPGDTSHVRDASDVNDQRGLGESELQEWDQALATGHDLCFIAPLLEEGKSVSECGGSGIVESGRKQFTSPPQPTKPPRRSPVITQEGESDHPFG
jgi:hypothetical protein